MTIDNYFYMMDSLKDFKFVVRVLDSVKTREQMITAERLFENFKKKWMYKVESVDMVDYIHQFNSKQQRLTKNLNLVY